MPNYFHHVPGRMRVRIPALKTNVALAQEVRRAAEAIPGVNSVEISQLTGSVLVHYSFHSETSTAILRVFSQRGMWPRGRSARGVTKRVSEKVAKAAAAYLIEALVERVIVAALLTLL